MCMSRKELRVSYVGFGHLWIEHAHLGCMVRAPGSATRLGPCLYVLQKSDSAAERCDTDAVRLVSTIWARSEGRLSEDLLDHNRVWSSF